MLCAHNGSVGDGGVSVVCDCALPILFNVLGIDKLQYLVNSSII